jgi:hypothetical protein
MSENADALAQTGAAFDGEPRIADAAREDLPVPAGRAE